MRVRRLDDNIYIVYYDGDLFRAYHSDVANTPFVSVQDINFNDRKYAYVVWKLSDDSEHLKLRSVKGDVIPKEKKNSTAVAKFWRRTRTILICSVKRSNSTKKRDRRFA